MAGKKHGKKKRFQQINRPKVQQSQADLTHPAESAAVMTPAAAPASKPAPAAKASQTGKSAPAVSKVVSHEYFASDLKRIGILMAVVVVILIILGIVLK